MYLTKLSRDRAERVLKLLGSNPKLVLQFEQICEAEILQNNTLFL